MLTLTLYDVRPELQDLVEHVPLTPRESAPVGKDEQGQALAIEVANALQSQTNNATQASTPPTDDYSMLVGVELSVVPTSHARLLGKLHARLHVWLRLKWHGYLCCLEGGVGVPHSTRLGHSRLMALGAGGVCWGPSHHWLGLGQNHTHLQKQKTTP